MDARTHYEVLGVTMDADRETIRRAYIALARATHPDRAVDGGVEPRERGDTIRRANEAWAVLGDEVRRRAYDESLRPRPTSAAAIAVAATHPDAPLSSAPSGFVVPARTAPLWKWGPVVVILAILAAVVIGSAYATSRDTSGSPTTSTSISRFSSGQCVDIGFSAVGKTAAVVPCSAGATGRIWSVVDSPRPCPANTTAVDLSDGRTTLCLVVVE